MESERLNPSVWLKYVVPMAINAMEKSLVNCQSLENPIKYLEPYEWTLKWGYTKTIKNSLSYITNVYSMWIWIISHFSSIQC